MLLFSTLPDGPGDKEFMEALYIDYERLMYATSARFSPQQPDQQDIVQESLTRLMEKLSLLRTFPDSILASYIAATVRNTSINYLKKKAGQPSPVSDSGDSLEELHTLVSPPELQVISKDTVLRMWDSLSPEDRTLLEGRYILGLTDQELAGLLNCKSSSIRMKMTRARRRALQWIHDEEVEPT